MTKERKRNVLRDCLKAILPGAIAIVLIFGIIMAVFALYGVSFEPVLYAFALIIALGAAYFAVFYSSERKKAADREQMKSQMLNGELPLEAQNLCEADYQEMLSVLSGRIREITFQNETDTAAMNDYLTTWVHQIKTPIAVMRLQLSQEENADRDAMEAELFRIETYVDMVLQYIRLGSETNDLLIREYSLDDLVRASIHKYAQQFILKGLSLNYKSTDLTVTTDKKWFACILEQLISNAVKYTQYGGITIEADTEGNLCVRDTGIGISPEDLPRIFGKGYTGMNGRLDAKSSGLGLYLAERAAEMLSVSLSVESRPGEGSCFTIHLSGITRPAEKTAMSVKREQKEA